MCQIAPRCLSIQRNAFRGIKNVTAVTAGCLQNASNYGLCIAFTWHLIRIVNRSDSRVAARSVDSRTAGRRKHSAQGPATEISVGVRVGQPAPEHCATESRPPIKERAGGCPRPVLSREPWLSVLSSGFDHAAPRPAQQTERRAEQPHGRGDRHGRDGDTR